MRRTRRVVVGVGALALAATLSGCAQPRWQSQILSLNPAGTDTGNGLSFAAAFSPDGEKVAFISEASNLGPTDTNGQPDVYVRDLTTGATTLASANAAGTDSGNGASGSVPSLLGDGVSFSPDSTKVLFVSNADNLGPTDTNAWCEQGPHAQICSDVYVRDLTTGVTSLVSANAAGTNSSNGLSTNPVFSPDGSKVAFVSGATDLGPVTPLRCTGVAVPPNPTPPPAPCGDVFVRDLATGTTSLVSASTTGTGGGNSTSFDPRFSPNGERVAFVSIATDLVSTTDVASVDVFVRDLTTSTTLLVSIDSTGTTTLNRESGSIGFSPTDNDLVLFQSGATNHGWTDGNGDSTDLFIRDIDAGTTVPVSINAAGTATGNRSAPYGGVFSPDGTKIVFTSLATDHGPTDTNNAYDVYMRDLTDSITSLVSTNTAGAAANSSSYAFTNAERSFSPDGTKLVIDSNASDFGPNDTNGDSDLYVVDLSTGTKTLVTSNAAGTDSADTGTGYGRFSPDGSSVLFTHYGTNLTNGTDTNGTGDVFLAKLVSPA